MAEGASYPIRIENSDEQTSVGGTLVFTDSNDQPSGDTVPFQPGADEDIVIVNDSSGDPAYDYDDDGGIHHFAGQVNVGSLIASASVQAADFAAIGLPGAVSATRYVGGTDSVAPTTGDFTPGDFVISLDGSAWVCTVGGTPGTWVALGSVLLAPQAAPTFTGHVTVPQATAVLDAAALNQLTSALTITSGTLPNLGSWVSGTAKVNPVTRQITVNVECVFDGTANAATVAIAISSDDSTYTTIGTPGVSVGVNTAGDSTQLVPVTLPAGWYIKLTIAAHATVAASIYY